MINIQNLAFSYGKNEVLRNISIDLEPGRIYGLLGENGVGKTTTIGKLAAQLKAEGKKVLLCAGDTFRAAAAEQLEIWAQRAGTDIVRHEEGSDPGAVSMMTTSLPRAFAAQIAS
ncbi:MAG: ATP-binding cassette domain-containing protein [Rhodococcus sp. (in: high G+C Gram-positive bacteria)]|uniref:ATP-binding cassette domain-containing protein n=1 Tax=Rhodococcus sp. TaxID=1831 RepID=UPI0033158FE2